MAIETLSTSGMSREEAYRTVIAQTRQLISDEEDLVANLANVSSLLKYTFQDYLWVGFYLTSHTDPEELVLGPFQGRPACTRIRFGKGVCGTSASEKRTLVVEDVDKFPGHIVCDSLSRSEIVVPIIAGGKVAGVLDVDSGELANFGETDKKYLEELAEILIRLFDK